MNKWLEEIPVFLDLPKADISRYCLGKNVPRLRNMHYSALHRVGARAVKWANLEEIKQFYIDCPEGYEVDHKIPCAGVLVTGLHVIENLQYLTKAENRKKRNFYCIK